MLAAFGASVLSNHVINIAGLNTHAEMTRIAAFSVIAGMHDHKIVGNDGAKEFEGHAM